MGNVAAVTEFRRIPCSITSATTRGYTGQEMMDPICQINMNARIYDPSIARFVSADPTVPHPMNGQSRNRYSYVGNRPLSRTDPSGYTDDGCGNGGIYCQDPTIQDITDDGGDGSGGSYGAGGGTGGFGDDVVAAMTQLPACPSGVDDGTCIPTITVTAPRLPPQSQTLSCNFCGSFGFGPSVSTAGLFGGLFGGGPGQSQKGSEDTMCRIAKSVQQRVLTGKTGPGTRFLSTSLNLTAGLGMNASRVFFADNSTGKFGYYDSVGFSVGLNAGVSIDVGFAANMSPADLASAETLSGGILVLSGSAIANGPNSVSGGSAGASDGGGFDLGLSANSSDPLDFRYCN